LRNEPPPEPISFDKSVRSRAFEAVVAFTNRDEFIEFRGAAKVLYCGEDFDELPARERDLVYDNESWGANLIYWLVFEATFDGPSYTMVEQFLARKAHTLCLSDRRYLEAMSRSHLRLYEVETVTRDVGLRLRDCWSDERFDVLERRFTQDAMPGMVVALRLRADPDGTHVIDGPGFMGFSHVDKEELLDVLRAEHEMVLANDKNADDRFSSYFAPVIAQHYVYNVLLRPPPRLTTTSGDPLLFCRVIFDILDKSALREGLESVKQIRRDEDGSLTWVRGKDKILHATFHFEDDLLVVETASAPRADAARALVKRQAGSAVRYRTTETTDPQQMLEEYRSRPESERVTEKSHNLAIPPEVEAQIIKEMQDKHYRSWLDTPLPVLGGYAPRLAVAVPGLRRTIVGLLRDLAVMSERGRLAGQPAYDSSWLWTELGLDPSE
jgi:hypothetical protein